MSRPDTDNYFMGIAVAVSKRATCKRRLVGAVVVLDGHVVSTGYNGSPKGEPHCIDVGCDIENGHCVRTVHAERNAVRFAGHERTNGATLYTTASPCRACMTDIMNANIVRVVYSDAYVAASHVGDRGSWSLEAAKRRGIEMVHLNAAYEAALVQTAQSVRELEVRVTDFLRISAADQLPKGAPFDEAFQLAKGPER